MLFHRCATVGLLSILLSQSLTATEGGEPSVAEKLSRSFVTVTQYNTEMKPTGTGSGFCVGRPGLIATCLHVIGQSRKVVVTLPDGSKQEPVQIVAWDKHLDLALLQVSDDNLVPLRLAPGNRNLKQGQAVMAMGNPLGHEKTLVSGIVAAPGSDGPGEAHLHVNLPIEPGNSGGPLCDREGTVYGIFNMKSATTPNLGFATKTRYLRTLIDRPSPISMSEWLKIGKLPDHLWKPQPPQSWHQRAGRITFQLDQPHKHSPVSSCFWKKDLPPELPFSVSVDIKIDLTSRGTAGLILKMPDQNCHRIWIPYNRSMMLLETKGDRLSERHIVGQAPQQDFRPQGWNRLRLDIHQGEIRCFLNGEKHCSYKEDQKSRDYSRIRIGLAAIDQPVATYKNFSIETNPVEFCPSQSGPDEMAVIQLATEGKPLNRELLERLATKAAGNAHLLKAHSQHHRETANRLEAFSNLVSERAVTSQIEHLLANEATPFPLVHASLLAAKLGEPELSPGSYLHQWEQILEHIASQFPAGATAARKADILVRVLFGEMGHHIARFPNADREFQLDDIRTVFEDREGSVSALTLFVTGAAVELDIPGLHATRLSGFLKLPSHSSSEAPRLLHLCDGSIETLGDQDPTIPCLAGLTKEEILTQLEPIPPQALLYQYLYILKNGVTVNRWPNGALPYLRTLCRLNPNSAEFRLERSLFELMNDADEHSTAKALRAILKEKPEDLDRKRLLKIFSFLGIAPELFLSSGK
ncbi:MAG: serine protease [Verrucomicrobiota bacterium]